MEAVLNETNIFVSEQETVTYLLLLVEQNYRCYLLWIRFLCK
jgi:hypothetical protein